MASTDFVTEGQIVAANAALVEGIQESTGSAFFVPPGALTVNCTTLAEATANRVYLQDKLDNFTVVVLPRSGGVQDGFDVDLTLLLNDGNHLVGCGPEQTQIRQYAGTNLDAIVASRNWYESSGTPAGDARNIRIFGVGVDGNYLDPSTGTERQTSGQGHGFAMAGFVNNVDWCGGSQTRGVGLFIDTTGRDGTTELGENLETHITNCVFTRCGYNGIHAADTAAIAGGVTDMYCKSNAIAHCNQRGATDDFGAAIFIQSGGGWEITGNHCYGGDGFNPGGNWGGYGPTQYTHGIEVKSAFGTRLIGNQVADFGYHLSNTADAHGISVQLQDRRPSVIVGNTIFTDEDAVGQPPIRDLYCIRVTTKANGEAGVTIGNNVTESRRADSHSIAATLKGIKLDAANGGTLLATVTGNLLYGVASGEELYVASGVTVKEAGNSWSAPIALRSESMTVVNGGSNASVARPDGWGFVTFVMDNGVTPTNALATDIIYNESA